MRDHITKQVPPFGKQYQTSSLSRILCASCLLLRLCFEASPLKTDLAPGLGYSYSSTEHTKLQKMLW